MSYAGERFAGWQWQKNTPNSVQAAIESRLQQLLGQSVRCIGCGRTDAGVHASQYFAHFDIDASELPAQFVRHLNYALSGEIVVHEVIPGQPNWHAQYNAIARTYCYHIHLRKNPFLQSRSTYLAFEDQTLAIDLMQQACQLLRQYEDYRAFCKVPDKHEHTRCTVQHATIQHYEAEDQIIFTITANRFVRGMVRLLVAQLLEVGRKKLSVAAFEQLLQSGERPRHFVYAPPQGLYLTQVRYPFLARKEQPALRPHYSH